MGLSTASFGPFTKGVVERANSSLSLTGGLKSCRNAVLSGINALSIVPGSQVALFLLDDQGTPAQVTSVRHIGPFADGSIAIGYSSVTHKAYLYRMDASLTGYYDASGVFTAAPWALPMAVIWSSMTAIPDVFVTEGLGTLYIAHSVASDANGLYWPTKTYTDFSSTTTSLVASGTDGSSAGTDTAYFNGVIAFQQALWGWGFGSGTTAANAFRPEMARYSPPSFGNLQVADSITVGDRVRSQRERIVGAGIAGDALILGATNVVTQVTGYGRDTWTKRQLDHSYGFVGPKCMVSAGDTLYYWSRRGPMRIEGTGDPEALYDAIPNTVASIAIPSTIVASFDPDRDQVIYTYNSGSGVRSWCAFDVRRDVWLGPDNDWGIAIACAGIVEPYTASTASPPSGPAGDPTGASTTSVGQTSAIANWVSGDNGAQSEMAYRVQGASTWTLIANAIDAGVSTYTFTSLSSSTAYEWRVRHLLYGVYSNYLGPSTDTQFTTTTGSGPTLLPPNSLTAEQIVHGRVSLHWVNSGEADVKTEIWRSAVNTASDFALIQTVLTGLSSANVSVPGLGTWYFQIRHVKDDGSTSDFTSPVPCEVVS
jgi:hypothetical protein